MKLNHLQNSEGRRAIFHFPLLIFHLLLLFGGGLRAQTGADFLRLVPDGRTAALGGGGAAALGSTAAQFHNVAGYALNEHRGGVAVSYAPWMMQGAGEMAVYSAAAFARWGRSAVSASVRTARWGDIILTQDGTSFTTQTASDFAVDAGYSRQIARRFAAGLALRYVSVAHAQHGGLASSGAFAADAGVLYRQQLSAKSVLSAGLSVRNAGTKIKLGTGTTASLPLTADIGVALSWTPSRRHLLAPTLSLSQPLTAANDGTRSLAQCTAAAGLEYGYRQQLFARAGYAYNSPRYGNQSHLALGAGVRYRGLSLDVAYLVSTAPVEAAIINTLRVTLTFTLGKSE